MAKMKKSIKEVLVFLGITLLYTMASAASIFVIVGAIIIFVSCSIAS